MEGKKNLVLGTLLAAFVLFSGAVTYQVFHKKGPMSLKTEGFLSMGKPNAPVEIVLIEDFQCRNCRAFSQMVIPKIQSEYIQTGKARFVLVPVSFLAGSQSISNAALEVYKQRPERFFPYLKEVLAQTQVADLKIDDLLRLAKKVGGIDLAKLQVCIEKGCHNRELDANLNWARDVMGLNFRTPALYINGATGSTFSFEAIQYQIEQILGKT